MQNLDEKEKREKEAQRKREWRAKQTAIADGSYILSPIEEAKQYLESLDDPCVAAVYNHPDLGKKVTQDDKRSLTNFVNHLRNKRKAQIGAQSLKIEQEEAISMKARDLMLQKTYDLQQSLLMPMTEEERAKLIKNQIDQNLFLFLEYMEASQVPSDDFLRIIVSLQNDLDSQSFKELFVRVCTYTKIEDLQVSISMVHDAMEILVDRKHDEKAAFGLLRLIYHNNITLTTFPREMLIKFQEQYAEIIPRFFKSIGGLEFQVSESLPPSAFCFTSPILRALREKGLVFYTQIPYQFIPYIIQIACYSFTENQESFDGFFQALKQGLKDHYNELVQNRFQEFLQRMLDNTKSMSPKFFTSLDNQKQAFEKSFSLLKQRQIIEFTPQIIKNLLDSNEEVLKQMQSKPRIVPKNSRMKLSSIIQGIYDINKGFDFSGFKLDSEIYEDQKPYFLAIGIEDPLPLQVICFNFCTSGNFNGRYVIQLETGCGKTALCFTIASHYAKKGLKAIIMNESEELTFRDYKKAEETCQDLQLQVNLVQRGQIINGLQRGLTFLSFSVFKLIIQEGRYQQFLNSVIICDEFDSIIFGNDEIASSAFKILPQLTQFIGFTGSDLKDIHVKAIQKAISGNLIRMNVNNVFKPPPVCKGVDVYWKITDFRDAIAHISAQQALKTPVIIIADDEKSMLAHKIQKADIMVEQLWKKSISESNGALSVFTRKQGEKYPVYIISDCQGRGLDFPTSTEIESNGGIFLIVAKLPSGYLQYKQFLGRTGRIGNKSQYIVVLYDQEAKSELGESYLEKNLVAMLNEDLQRISQRLSSQPEDQQRTTSEQRYEEQKEQEVKAQSSLIDISSSIYSQQKSLATVNEASATKTIQSSHLLDTQRSEQSLEYSVGSEVNSQGFLVQKKRETKMIRKQGEKINSLTKDQEKKKELRDKIFFDNYSKSEIHQQMCNDHVRIDAYKAALSQIANGQNVVDIGSGTGVLSFLAVESGANLVYAIENSDIYKSCKQEIKKRGLQHKIKMMNCKAEEAPLEGIKVDLLVSEWMGYFLLFERMLPSVLSVRDRCLDKAGKMIPARARIYISGAEINQDYKIEAKQATQSIQSAEAIISSVEPENIASSSFLVLDLDLLNAPTNFDSFSSDFDLKISKDCVLNAIIGWFEVEMSPGVWLSTSPFSEKTHWEQTVFPLLEPQQCKLDQRVIGKIECNPSSEDHRGLTIHIFIHDQQSQEISVTQYWIQ